MAIPKKVELRIIQGVTKFRPILEQAKSRDVNEADTVTIVKGILADVFGWNPFFDVTSEFAIRSTYVDLVVRSDERVMYVVEVKAIGGDLKDNHLRQAVGYAANQGVEWVVLTNGASWQVHRVIFAKPIANELVFQIDMIGENPKTESFQSRAFLLTKEGTTKSAITQFHAERQALSKFNVAAILQQDEALAIVRRELRRAYPTLNPTLEQVRALLVGDVLKRDVVEGEKADAARRAMRKANRSLRTPSTPAITAAPIAEALEEQP